jgi:predicted secreted Zn-dependent protease
MKRRILKKLLADIKRLERENHALRIYSQSLENNVMYFKSKSP